MQVVVAHSITFRRFTIEDGYLAVISRCDPDESCGKCLVLVIVYWRDHVLGNAWKPNIGFAQYNAVHH